MRGVGVSRRWIVGRWRAFKWLWFCVRRWDLALLRRTWGRIDWRPPTEADLEWARRVSSLPEASGEEQDG
jgi:hypothetical protein